MLLISVSADPRKCTWWEYYKADCDVLKEIRMLSKLVIIKYWAYLINRMRADCGPAYWGMRISHLSRLLLMCFENLLVCGLSKTTNHAKHTKKALI